MSDTVGRDDWDRMLARTAELERVLHQWVEWVARNGPEINGIISLQTIRTGRQAYTGSPWPIDETKKVLGL